MRIHSDNRPAVSFKRLLRRHLNIEINRQLQVLSGNSCLSAETPDFLAVTIDQRSPRTILSHQDLVIELLDTALTDNRSRLIRFVLRRVQVLFADLANVSDEM